MEERTKSGRAFRGPTTSRILMLCAGAFAVEVAYIIEEGYAIPTMLATGLSETVASAMWAVAPLLGLFFHGYIGSASDRCTSGWGKRRPFIFALAVCACIAIFLFPHGTFLSESLLHLGEKSAGVFVMIFTASIFVAMDFFLDALHTPLRAYLLDAVPAERSEQANYTFTALMCMGAIAGSIIAGIPWSTIGRHRPEVGGVVIGNRAEGNNAKGSGRQLEVVYSIAAVIFAVCILLCLNSVQEKNKSTHQSPSVEKQISLPLSSSGKPRKTLKRNEFSNDFTLSSPWKHSVITEDELALQIKAQTTANTNGIHFIPALRGPSPLPILKNAAADHLTPLTTSGAKGLLSCFVENIYENISGIILFSKYLSRHFFWLCLAVLLSWIAFMSMFLYFTSFMGQVVYGGNPYAPSGEEKELFDHGVRIGFFVILLQDFVTMVCCLSMTWLSDYVGVWQLMVGVLATYAAVCLTAAVWPSLHTVILLQLVTGLLYSIMQSLPYTLLSYYEEAGILLSKPWPHKSDTTTGKAISLLCMHIFLAQFLVAMTMGFLVQYFGTHRVTLFVSFGGSCLAAITALHVTVPPQKNMLPLAT